MVSTAFGVDQHPTRICRNPFRYGTERRVKRVGEISCHVFFFGPFLACVGPTGCWGRKSCPEFVLRWFWCLDCSVVVAVTRQTGVQKAYFLDVGTIADCCFKRVYPRRSQDEEEEGQEDSPLIHPETEYSIYKSNRSGGLITLRLRKEVSGCGFSGAGGSISSSVGCGSSVGSEMVSFGRL